MRARYRDRREAGEELAGCVAGLVSGPAVVAGIPRGGILVAAPIAERLGAALTLVHVRKVTVPGAPEFAIGAMDEDGYTVTDEATAKWIRGTAEEVAEARRKVRQEIERQRRLYDVTPLAWFAGRATVVLVDDGLATGLTMGAAVAYARRHGASRLVVAVPCASSAAAERFKNEADQFVCPCVDASFRAVGVYYLDFAPVRDEDVVAALDRASGRIPGVGREP